MKRMRMELVNYTNKNWRFIENKWSVFISELIVVFNRNLLSLTHNSVIEREKVGEYERKWKNEQKYRKTLKYEYLHSNHIVLHVHRP